MAVTADQLAQWSSRIEDACPVVDDDDELEVDVEELRAVANELHDAYLDIVRAEARVT